MHFDCALWPPTQLKHSECPCGTEQMYLSTSLERQEHFSQFQDMTDALSCRIRLPVCLWIMNPHSRAPKKKRSHGNELLLQDTMHLLQRPCYQQGCPCQDPAGNWTTRKPPDHCKEMQTTVVWSCLPFIRSCQTFLQGTVKGGRRQGRERKKWEDNVIREWTGLEFAKSQRAVENREKWRKLVAKSSVVPQRPSWLRSRWDERWERVWTQMDMCFTQSLVMVFNVIWGVQTLSQLTFLSAGFIWCGWPLGDGRFCHVLM